MDKEVKTLFLKPDEVEINSAMALRFLRVRREVDEQVKGIFRQCVDEFLENVNYKACYRYFDIKIEDDIIFFDDVMQFQSKKLAKNLSGCKGAFLFVATTSAMVDRLINKHMNLQLSRAMMIDAIGSSAVECFCDSLCRHIEDENNIKLRPRFSPGYGDLSIKYQSVVLGVCDCSRKIGVMLTHNNMMVPRKSVSAIVGVRPENEKCEKSSSCENCDSKNCPYRE